MKKALMLAGIILLGLNGCGDKEQAPPATNNSQKQAQVEAKSEMKSEAPQQPVEQAPETPAPTPAPQTEQAAPVTTELQEGKQYIQVSQQANSQKEVIEFFSFYCPHCYAFEMEYKIPQQVKEGLPEGVSFKQYHVNFLGAQSENLTRAWALAMALGVEGKVKVPLFEAAQKNALKSMDDIRAIFLNNGVTAEQFDGGINSFAVNGLVNKQVNAAEQFGVRGVPDFYVNGKFRVNPEGLNYDDFVKDYVETVKGLLQK